MLKAETNVIKLEMPALRESLAAFSVCFAASAVISVSSVARVVLRLSCHSGSEKA
jgi:hypothetical protein